MHSSNSNTSVAGVWGDGKRRLQHQQTLEEFRSSTTTRESYQEGYLKTLIEKNQKNTYSQFRSTQDKSFMLLPYGVENPHFKDIPFEEERFDPAMYETASGLSKGREPSSSSLKRTQHKLSTLSLAPVAIGRSGFRTERGVSTSGLGGEKLCLSNCTSVNSLVQRTWVPYEDPALQYKINGVPTAKPISGMSLPIGEGQNKLEVGWVHQRKAALTGKMYAKGLGTFYDEYLSPIKATHP